MHKSIVEKQLKKYMTYSVKNDEFILNADKMSELSTELVKLFAIPVVSQQSEQLECEKCGDIKHISSIYRLCYKCYKELNSHSNCG